MVELIKSGRRRERDLKANVMVELIKTGRWRVRDLKAG